MVDFPTGYGWFRYIHLHYCWFAYIVIVDFRSLWLTCLCFGCCPYFLGDVPRLWLMSTDGWLKSLSTISLRYQLMGRLPYIMIDCPASSTCVTSSERYGMIALQLWLLSLRYGWFRYICWFFFVMAAFPMLWLISLHYCRFLCVMADWLVLWLICWMLCSVCHRVLNQKIRVFLFLP